jgi:hypothetical protein
VGIEHVESNNSILTEAFHRPAILASSRDFVASNRRFALTSGTNLNDPIRALLIGWTTRKEYIAYLIMVVILLSITAGVVVGVLVRNTSLGLAVCSGLATLLSCIEVLICWHFR